MIIVQYAFVFILGLILGSFFNVCIFRIPNEQSIVKPSSHCPNCNTPLKGKDLVPVLSHLFLGGKCRYCKTPISIRYTLVELLTAVVYVVLFYKFGLTVEFLAATFLMSVLICVFFIDLDHKIIPNGLVITGLVGSAGLFAYNLFGNVSFYGDNNWWTPLLGILVGSGTFFLIALIGSWVYKTEDALGMGDVKIFIPIGIFLGWKLTIIALCATILLAGLMGIVLIFAGKRDRKSTMPLGPFIVTGVFIALLWGWQIIDWWYYNYLGNL